MLKQLEELKIKALREIDGVSNVKELTGFVSSQFSLRSTSQACRVFPVVESGNTR